MVPHCFGKHPNTSRWLSAPLCHAPGSFYIHLVPFSFLRTIPAQEPAMAPQCLMQQTQALRQFPLGGPHSRPTSCPAGGQVSVTWSPGGWEGSGLAPGPSQSREPRAAVAVYSPARPPARPTAAGTGSLACSWRAAKWPEISSLGAGFRFRPGSHTSSFWLGSLSRKPTSLRLFTLL